MKLTPTLIQQRIHVFKDRCRAEGLSLTHQRLEVYSRLAATLSHPTAEELYQGIHRDYPTLSLGTVYKTLDVLEQHGFITKLRAMGESARYDANLQPHHHLVCKTCGCMQDIADEKAVRLAGLQMLQSEDQFSGFQVDEVRIDFRGSCGPCRVKEKNRRVLRSK